MTFAEQVEVDLPSFLNPTEFGKVRVVDGSPVACDLQEEARATDAKSGDGVYLREAVLRIRDVDMPVTPVITQRMVIDAKTYRVVHVLEEQGLLVITLEWSES